MLNQVFGANFCRFRRCVRESVVLFGSVQVYAAEALLQLHRLLKNQHNTPIGPATIPPTVRIARCVAEIEIDKAEAEPGKTSLEGWFYARRSMIRVPQFRGYKIEIVAT